MRGMIFFIAVALSAVLNGEEKQGSLRVPMELEGTHIEDKVSQTLPLDVILTNQDGQKIQLRDYFNASDKRPVLLTLGYYGCPMLCSLVINGLVSGLKTISFKPGLDYRIFSVSIDDRETAELAQKKQHAYVEALSGQKDAKDTSWWQFHVGDKEAVKRLADSVGFNYRYDKKTGDFAHGAGIFVVTPAGVLSRTLLGITFDASDLKPAIHEASNGQIGSFIDRVILSCFHYNPDSHRYGIYIMGVMRLSGVVTILVLGIVLLMFFRADRKRMKNVIG